LHIFGKRSWTASVLTIKAKMLFQQVQGSNRISVFWDLTLSFYQTVRRHTPYMTVIIIVTADNCKPRKV
jgi:hypothetical protein